MSLCLSVCSSFLPSGLFLSFVPFLSFVLSFCLSFFLFVSLLFVFLSFCMYAFASVCVSFFLSSYRWFSFRVISFLCCMFVSVLSFSFPSFYFCCICVRLWYVISCSLLFVSFIHFLFCVCTIFSEEAIADNTFFSETGAGDLEPELIDEVRTGPDDR